MFAQAIDTRRRRSLSRSAVRAATAIVLAALTSAADAAAEEPRRVAVLPFENATETQSDVEYDFSDASGASITQRRLTGRDRYAEVTRSLLEDALVGLPNVVVVAEARLDSALARARLDVAPGDVGAALALGKLVGADAVVLGTVESVRTIGQETRAYGVDARTTRVIATLRIRVVDLRSGSVTFSTRTRGEIVSPETSSARQRDSDAPFAAFERAIETLGEDYAFRAALRGRGSHARREALADLRFAPVPEGAEIHVDGVYRGSSPLDVELPPGRLARVIIRKEGFEDWSSVIEPDDGLVIAPTLRRAESRARKED